METSTLRIGAFRWSNGAATKYQHPGATSTFFYGNNDLGDIVGAYQVSGGRNHALVRSNGQTIAFDFPGAYSTVARGINRYGTIVGFFTASATSGAVGFRKRAGGWTTLRYPNSIQTVATGVSDTGEVVGWYSDAEGFSHGFSWSNGMYKRVDYPVGAYTEIHGINKYGSLVGQFQFTSDDFAQAWQRKGGAFSQVTYPNSVSTILNGISNLGDEVGVALLSGGKDVGFLRSCR